MFEIDKPQLNDMHPVRKPVELVGRMIANTSQPGELVYDPFVGSGTTIVAAHQLGRVSFGVEIDPEYVAVTLERLAVLGLVPKLVATVSSGRSIARVSEARRPPSREASQPGMA
jgi:DNA modification methylase